MINCRTQKVQKPENLEIVVDDDKTTLKLQQEEKEKSPKEDLKRTRRG